jgi:hypothetical protein
MADMFPGAGRQKTGEDSSQENPWLNFEAGALTKQLNPDNTDQSRVCPLLIGMTPADVTGPLKLHQMVKLDRDGMLKIAD